MAKPSLNSLDIQLLHYFSVIAEEGSLTRAAERLFISQPPLSLHLKNLEERLGVTLFFRHHRGLELTEDGKRALALIQPLLRAHEKTVERLASLSSTEKKGFTMGFTTGFEQGVFWGVEKRLRAFYGDRVRIVRESSNPLVQLMRKGAIDVSLVALPLHNVEGLAVRPLPYAEARILALPEAWLHARNGIPPLKAYGDKPLFRLRRDHNPGFFEFTKSVFFQADFEPKYIEEPMAHDVLLASIAAGEGMGLLPLSFTAIRRDGVVYGPVRESNTLLCRLAIAALPDNAALLETVASEIEPELPAQWLV